MEHYAEKTASAGDATVSEGEKSEKETQEEDTDEKVGLESQLLGYVWRPVPLISDDHH